VPDAEWDSYRFRCVREKCGWRYKKWQAMCGCTIFNTIVEITPIEPSIDGPCTTTIQQTISETQNAQETPAPTEVAAGRNTDHLKAYQFQKKPIIEPSKSPTIETQTATPSNGNIAIEPTAPRSKRAREIRTVHHPRLSTGFPELDHFFGGGGPLEGCLAMVAAPPGAGKSTLLTEVLAAMTSIHGENGLYAAGEEGEAEVALRAREGSGEIDGGVYARWPGSIDRFCIHECTSPEEVVEEIDRSNCLFAVVDSAGSSESDKTSSGDNAQITHAAKIYFQRAQARGPHVGKRKCIIFLIMHCTKDGDLAGPNKAVHEASFGVMIEHVDPVTLHPVEEPSSTIRLRVYKKSRGSSNKRKCYFDWEDSDSGRLIPRSLDADGNAMPSMVVQKKAPEKPEKSAYPQRSVPDLNLPPQPKSAPKDPSETPLDSPDTTG
jgi:predicted ATP-dependent serine protease